MKPFQPIVSVLIPLPRTDIDTDQIIPARYLKGIDKTGLAEGLFAGWRRLPDGSPDPTFPLNRPEYASGSILLAGDNFGCGSSREHAPWALMGRGIRAVISTSFADIFCNNALKNGLLPVVVGAAEHQELLRRAESSPSIPVTISLADQTLSYPDGYKVVFPIDSFNKTCLLEGLDSIGYLLKYSQQIEEYERNRNVG
jgi:3-isopropylmalate/(R)-2-methylmalate dehydratase small subunit